MIILVAVDELACHGQDGSPLLASGSITVKSDMPPALKWLFGGGVLSDQSQVGPDDAHTGSPNLDAARALFKLPVYASQTGANLKKGALWPVGKNKITLGKKNQKSSFFFLSRIST